jgi:L,D-transpeptidase ErfK/SrfK
VQRRSIELVVDQADGIPTMVGERLTRMAADKGQERSNPDEPAEPEQKLYF